jgi:type I restriction enzyme M protein
MSVVLIGTVDMSDKDSGIDFDTEMKRIQKDFKTEKESQNQLMNAFKVLGYEL